MHLLYNGNTFATAGKKYAAIINLFRPVIKSKSAITKFPDVYATEY